MLRKEEEHLQLNVMCLMHNLFQVHHN